MKKLMLALVALVMVGISFTGCKVEKSEVTVSVYDVMGNPINNRAVLYTDAVSAALDTFIPSPESLVTDIPDGMQYALTNAQGTVTIPFDLSVSKLTYYFYVFDEGSQKWLDKTVELVRGKNAEIKFEVNR